MPAPASFEEQGFTQDQIFDLEYMQNSYRAGATSVSARGDFCDRLTAFFRGVIPSSNLGMPDESVLSQDQILDVHYTKTNYMDGEFMDPDTSGLN